MESGKDGEQLKREATVQIVQGPDEHLSLRNDEDIVLNSILLNTQAHVHRVGLEGMRAQEPSDTMQ